ncbi:MAG TPA: tetratricopeptide repeat protein [Hyphomicrobiaceae bacterium]|nr:tetratricopeptide repeat protein [Hyphomicrobiaceae bacterium]
MRLRFWAVLSIALAVAGPAHAAGEEGMRLAQEAARAQMRGSLEQALALYGQALADVTLANDRRASILSDRGVVYARLKQPKLALDDYNRAVQLYPENPAVYNNRGTTLLSLGLVREAIKDFDRAIMLAPGYAAAYNNRAGAHLLLKQGEEALRDYTKAIALAPQTAAPLSGRGRALLALDRPESAIRDFTRALANDARFSPGYRFRAEAKLELERFSEAIEDLSRAIAFEPGNPEYYMLRGHAYLAARNVAAAIKDFSKVIELEPQSPRAYESRAFAYAKIDAFDEAETDLARALELDPRAAAAYAYRAWVYAKTEQPQLAQRELDKAMKLEPERAEVLSVKGALEEAQGRVDEAIETYRRALAAKWSFREPAEALERLGLGAELAETVEMRGLGIDSWRVVRQGRRLQARSDEYPKIRVPLEMAGKGQPRLLEWEVKKPPFKDIALLRFSAGRVATPEGAAEEVEHIAVLDLAAGTVAGIVPHRQGSKYATWTWDDSGKVTVAAVDGVTDELVLRTRREVVATAPRRPESIWGFPPWAPWNQEPYAPRSDSRPRARSQPKSIFELIFGK